MIAERLRKLYTGFSSSFWIANTLELFERLAYYGSKAVLTYYLANKVGLQDEAGTLAGIFNFVLYFLPVVAGVFVDKYGFRKTLIACFTFFCVGYFLIGLAGMEYGEAITGVIGKRNYVLGVLLLTAVGGSLIKPCIVGTVAKTTSEDVRALGYSIYYMLVNLGGAIGPILAMEVRQSMGIEYVLIMSSITSFLLIVGTVLFFREPQTRDGEERRTFAKVFSDMVLVFGNLKFMTFLLIFSGFWMMFWQIFYSFPFYVTDVLKFERFEILETVDAWTIIFLSVPVTALVKKWKPITAMTVGFSIASLSWVIIGAVPAIWSAVLGVAIFALGEATQAPRFYEYVGSLAPRNQVGTFMGFAFLPVAIGSVTAGGLADWLRNTYLQTNPSMMWYTLAGIGLTSTLLMLVYNVVVSKSKN
ncbi:MAG: MFS transporter [Cyclobacteriaceae bacterium]|nr:MFS transporter [Cyclobacteriaceae bacterium]MCX7637938.1 MFS transporter [Cyclobacteriaceae bacterium]MDW8332178.1 MFS transporter [Cyclobacteriaceae bacterium]